MGVFFESEPKRPVVSEVMKTALLLKPDQIGDPRAEADRMADDVTNRLSNSKTFKTGRFLGALAILVVIAIAAIMAERSGLTEGTKALWGLAATVFGVIVGLLGGESTTS